jgi:hypothetical protein
MTNDVSINDEVTMNDDEIASIINQDDNVVPVTEEEFDEVENICDGASSFETLEKNETVLDNFPQLRGDDYPEQYVQIKDIVISNYRSLPPIDFQSVYDELDTLFVKSGPTPTVQQIGVQLQKVQAAKERLAEIMAQVVRTHTIKKRSVDILKDAWGKFSKGSSSDKRNSDAAERLVEFESDLTQVDSLQKTCQHILKNLDSQQENLSRRITIFGLQLKIHDSGRMIIPDHDFSSRQDFEGTLVSSGVSGEEIDPTEAVEPDELSF